MVTREPEWDDDDRFRLLGLTRYEAEVCSCGYHPSLAEDAENVFTPTERVCPVCRGADRYGRMQRHADEEHEKHIPESAHPATPRPADGRTTYMRLMDPSEVNDLRRGG